MAIDPVKNFAKVQVLAVQDSDDTSIQLVSGHGARLPLPSSDGAFNLVWYNDTDYPDPTDDSNVEIVRVTARAGDTLTVTRGQEGTVASNKNTVGKVYKMILALTKKTMDDIDDVLDAVPLKIPATEKAAANGVATLDSGGKIPSSQLPALSISETFVVASQAAMLALTAQRGDFAVRTDIDTTFVLSTDDPTTLANWVEVLVRPEMTWEEITVNTKTMEDNHGYQANNSTLVTFTLPAVAALNSRLRVVGKGAGGWKIKQNAGQTIHFKANDTVTGLEGSLNSTGRRDAVELICTVANSEWTVISHEGDIEILNISSLAYRGIDIMGLTKDLMRQNITDAQFNSHVEQIKEDFPNLNLIGISIVNNTQAEATAASVSPFYEEPWTRKNRWMDKIHSLGMNILDRATDCFFEGLYDIAKVNKRNGNRYTYFGTPIEDTFSSTATRDHGYGRTSAAGNLTSQYLTSHQSGNTWSIVSGELTGPAANGWVRSILFNQTYMRDVTMVALVKKVGHQQIIVRASTDSNFPGYGLQMRDTNKLRLERPGLASLAEVPKTWVTGNYYWLKLQAIGSAIKGKAWAASSSSETFDQGVLTEPGGWDIEVTDATYDNNGVGYCGFSGESSTGKFKYMRITPQVDTDTWLYRYFSKVEANIDHFVNGDILGGYPEAPIHYPMTNQGTYNQFFIDMNYLAQRIGSQHNKELIGGMTGHLFTSSIQGQHNALFSDIGIASYDHYGAAIGPDKLSGSFSNDSGAAGSQTYTVPTTIIENATNRQDFIPEKTAYNRRIRVWVVNKGTGNWTMTIHGPDGNPVKMYDNTDLNVSVNSYQRTILNANITNGAWLDFDIDWYSLNTDQTHHFHLTSTVADGTVKTTVASDLNACSCVGYRWYARPEAMEIDIRNMYRISGVPQFLQEWGDYWSKNPSLIDVVLTQEEHEAYLTSFYDMFQRLIDDGILIGFNYWRSGFGLEGLYNNPGSPYNYVLQYNGVPLQTFFNNNGDQVLESDPTWHFNVVPSGIVNGVNRTFTVPYPAEELVVYADGVRLLADDSQYTFEINVNTTIITFVSGKQPFSSISVDFLPS